MEAHFASHLKNNNNHALANNSKIKSINYELNNYEIRSQNYKKVKNYEILSHNCEIKSILWLTKNLNYGMLCHNDESKIQYCDANSIMR